jgi:LytS/YehU family sensor histidine kinase
MIDAALDQETLLREAVENDDSSAILRLSLKSAIEAHAIAVADASHILKVLTIVKKVDCGNDALISELVDHHAQMQALEFATRRLVDKAVNDLAEAEADATTRFHARSEG